VDKEGDPIANDFYPSIEMVVTPGPLEEYSLARKLGALTADVDFISNVDRLNHPSPAKTDAQGRVQLRALIPGATYRIQISQDGDQRTATSFQVKAGETRDLGDIVWERGE
jgi:hypothetical protein